MCDPVTAMAGLGVATSAIGAGKQAKAANQAAEYNAQMGERQAAINEDRAQDATKRGETEARRVGQRADSVKSSQRASFGASGVLVDSGSTMDTVLDTTEQGEQDAMTVRRNASREAYGLRQGAANDRFGAKAQRAGKQSVGAAAGLSLLGGASAYGADRLSANASKKGS